MELSLRNSTLFTFSWHTAMAAGAGLLGLSGVSCDEPQTGDAGRVYRPREPIPFSMPTPNTRTREIRPEAYRFLEAISEMEGRIGDLELALDEAQELHEAYDFDRFMAMDAAFANQDELFYLAHFCDGGYFTVQRKVLVHLLEQKLARKNNDAWAALSSGGSKDLEQRLAEAMLFREEHIMDLEEVVNLYETRQGAGEFFVPAHVPNETLESLRTEVAAKLQRQREIATELDLEIERLRDELR